MSHTKPIRNWGDDLPQGKEVEDGLLKHKYEYFIDQDGKIIERRTTIIVEKTGRKKIAPFGDAKSGKSNDKVTFRSVDPVFITPPSSGAESDESKIEEFIPPKPTALPPHEKRKIRRGVVEGYIDDCKKDPLVFEALQEEYSDIINGSHTYEDFLKIANEKQSISDIMLELSSDNSDTSSICSSTSSNAYVPPGKRTNTLGRYSVTATSSPVELEPEKTEIRVSELPDDYYKNSKNERDSSIQELEDTLRDLFRRFGRIRKIYIPTKTIEDCGFTSVKQCRGFAFIEFSSQREAQKAINEMNRSGFANRILKVDFAKPRQDVGMSSSYKSGYGKALPQTYRTARF